MSIKLLKLKSQEKAQEKAQDSTKKQQEAHKKSETTGQVNETRPVKPNGVDAKIVSNGVTSDKETIATATITESSSNEQTAEFEAPLVWRNIILFVLLHAAIPVALMMVADPETRPQWRTTLWMYAGAYISGLGITGGAHRLWSHRAYKARVPIELLLMCLQTMAGQNSILTWCRDHRVHHKFSETDADPHNIKRGFFFAHMGWLCCRKHPEVSAKGKLIDMSDLEQNPIVMFQHRHFWWLAILFTVLLPTMIPVWFWSERFWTSFVFAFMIRYLITLHSTWLVNSAAHYHGSRPYDRHIEARESPWVIAFGLGEGFHNFHHTFPFDYSTSEFGKLFNVTTTCIDLLAGVGLVYDRRKMDKRTIELRQMRTGERAADEDEEEVGGGGALKRANGCNGIEEEPANGRRSMRVSSKLVAPFNLDYISGPTSLKYTM